MYADNVLDHTVCFNPTVVGPHSFSLAVHRIMILEYMCHLTTTQSVYLHTYCIPLNSGILVHVLDVYTHSSSYIHAVDVFTSLHHCTFLNFADFTIGQIAGMIVGAFLFCLLITILPIVLCCICCCCCSRCGASE